LLFRFIRVIGEENKKEIVSWYQGPPFARDETSFSIKKGQSGEETARKRPKKFRDGRSCSMWNVPGFVQIDKSKRPDKKYISSRRANANQKKGHPHHSLFSQSFLVRLPHFLALGADRFRVRALLHGCDYREFVFMWFMDGFLWLRKNERLGCTSERARKIRAGCFQPNERKYASGMVLVLNIINKINGFGVLNPESASHS